MGWFCASATFAGDATCAPSGKFGSRIGPAPGLEIGPVPEADADACNAWPELEVVPTESTVEPAPELEASGAARLAADADICAAKLAAAQAQGEKLGGTSIKLSQKAGVDGRLFGSVTNFDIAEELTKNGYEVAKSQIRMPTGPIKLVGDSTVSVALHTDVVVDITVSVYGETA